MFLHILLSLCLHYTQLVFNMQSHEKGLRLIVGNGFQGMVCACAGYT